MARQFVINWEQLRIVFPAAVPCPWSPATISPEFPEKPVSTNPVQMAVEMRSGQKQTASNGAA